MNSDRGASEIPQVEPARAWEILEQNPDAQLIDVRTQSELVFVGVPDISGLGKTLHCVEWAGFPGMSKNQNFAEELAEHIGPNPKGPLLFLCRSGVRSNGAALLMAQHLSLSGARVECCNVLEGFEGDLDANGHRGRLNGWKFRGLAWRQS